MSKKPLTILFAPLSTRGGIGHMNACIGVAQVLHESGHRIVFAVNDLWRAKLSAYGFEEELISDPERESSDRVVSKKESLLASPPIDKMRDTYNRTFIEMMTKEKSVSDLMIQIIDRIAPHVIVIDHLIINPAIISRGIPWVLLCSSNPLCLLSEEHLPPPGLGLPSNESQTVLNAYKLILKDIKQNTFRKYNEWFAEYGLKPIPESSFYYPLSPYLNIYDYPLEIDYTDKLTLPPNTYQFDHFMRSTEPDLEFNLPQQFKAKPGKLIFLSMGSRASAYIALMKRLVAILSKSPHKFIVSTGQLHDQYELTDNMWGQAFLPQTRMLPLVDLVISHGGNNTFTEAFYFGKPMIIMPTSGDQYDNAQRVHETGYGIRLDTMDCSETELLEAIEKLVNDNNLKVKLEKISERIQTSKSLNKVVDLIEALVK